MKMNKIVSLILALALVIGVMTGCGTASSPASETDSNSTQSVASVAEENVVHATLTVTGADGAAKDFALECKEGTTLAMAMLDAGLVSEAEAKAGFITIIDGEEAKWDPDQAFWKLLDSEGNMTEIGAGEIVLNEGDSYSFTYTVG